jgi:hypothetical protein
LVSAKECCSRYVEAWVHQNEDELLVEGMRIIMRPPVHCVRFISQGRRRVCSRHYSTRPNIRIKGRGLAERSAVVEPTLLDVVTASCKMPRDSNLRLQTADSRRDPSDLPINSPWTNDMYGSLERKWISM